MQTQTQPPAPTSEPKDPLISIQHVGKRFRSVNALSDFSLEIPRGTIFGLIGPNGAGKTTLLRILSGLMPPTFGKIIIDGVDLSRNPANAQRKIGYMPDFF